MSSDKFTLEALSEAEVRQAEGGVVIQAVADAEQLRLSRVADPDRLDPSEEAVAEAVSTADAALKRFKPTGAEKESIENVRAEAKLGFLKGMEKEYLRLVVRGETDAADAQKAAILKVRSEG